MKKKKIGGTPRRRWEIARGTKQICEHSQSLAFPPSSKPMMTTSPNDERASPRRRKRRRRDYFFLQEMSS